MKVLYIRNFSYRMKATGPSCPGVPFRPVLCYVPSVNSIAIYSGEFPREIRVIRGRIHRREKFRSYLLLLSLPTGERGKLRVGALSRFAGRNTAKSYCELPRLHRARSVSACSFRLTDHRCILLF